jgi:hypothetical protein
MEERREIHQQDFPQLPNLGLLVGVIVAAFIAIGATVYFFGEDQSQMSAANTAPATQSPRMMKQRAPASEPGPTTTGQGGTQ